MPNSNVMLDGQRFLATDNGDGTFTLQVDLNTSDAITASIAPGENHLGEVGGNEAVFSTDFGPASSKTYASGQIIGTLIEVTGAARAANRGGLMTSAGIVLNAANTSQIDVLVFSSQPSGTFTDGASLALSLADAKKLSKVYHITDWTSLATGVSHGQAPAEPRIYKCQDGTKTTSLWAVLVARGALTLAAATDGNLSVRFARN